MKTKRCDVQENCWFLSSLIAGLLVRLGDGIFESGRLLYPNIATELRRYMYLRYFIEIGVSPGFLTVCTFFASCTGIP